MKNILLATTALVAFAGAAAAEVSFSGEAVVGYTTYEEFEDGVETGAYASIDLDVEMSQDLDNGLAAAASFGFGVADAFETVDGIDAGDAEFSLTGDAFGLYVGVDGGTDDATEVVWDGVSNMDNDGFYESADDFDEDVIRAEATLGAADLVVAYNADTEDFDLGVTAEFGDISVGAVFEEEGDNTNYGLFGSATFAGATVDFAHSEVEDESSTGVEVTYPVGDLSVSAFYVSQSDVDDNYGATVKYSANGLSVKAFGHGGNDEDHGIELGYDISDVLSVYAGHSYDDGEYVGVEYDLGGGASVLASWGEDDTSTGNDEVGPQEYNEGITVELTLAF